MCSLALQHRLANLLPGFKPRTFGPSPSLSEKKRKKTSLLNSINFKIWKSERVINEYLNYNCNRKIGSK